MHRVLGNSYRTTHNRSVLSPRGQNLESPKIWGLMGHTGMRPVGPPNRRLVYHSTIFWLTTATANIIVTTIMPHRRSRVGSLHSPLHMQYQPKWQAAHCHLMSDI